MHLTITSETARDGIVERSFTVGDIPGVLWSPVSPAAPTPLLLMGHGGGLHKRAPGLVARAHAAVLGDGFHVASIDSPGHGDRLRDARDQEWVDALLVARREHRSLEPVVSEFNASLAERAVPEWRVVIDALQALPEIGADSPIGYSGMTLASAIGIPLAAGEPRIAAAVFGGAFAYEALLDAARSVTIPVQYLLPWDDAEIGRDHGLRMFDAFASIDKTLLAFPGSHMRVPVDRVDTRFFARQLR